MYYHVLILLLCPQGDITYVITRSNNII